MGAEETLAAAVLALAIEDMGRAKTARKKAPDVRDAQDAERFLFSPDGSWRKARCFWCACADVSPQWFEQKVTRRNVRGLAERAAAYRTQYNRMGTRES